MEKSPRYKRILLKLSGESLTGEKEFGIEADVLNRFATEVDKAHKLGVEIAIVIGGGNIFRGLSEKHVRWIACRLIIWECWLR